MKLNSNIFAWLLCTAVLGAGATAVIAQHSPQPESFRANDDQGWIDDPHFHEFYQATIDAFAKGPAQVDRASYEKRSRRIFTALAVSRKMPPEHLVNHLAKIPGEMIEIVTRDPHTLDSYESFVESLFGPRSFPADAPQASAL